MFRKLATVVGAIVLGMTVFGAAPAAAQPGTVVIGGGSGIIIDQQFECTVTTVGRDGAGRLVGLTAGHCGEAGSHVLAEANPFLGEIGRFTFSNPDLDYAVIEFNPAKVVPVNRIGNVTIANVGAPAQFPHVVCKEGRTTGHTCGIAFGDIFQTGIETWSQMCVVEGDSGAPVVVGNTLVGMVNAYLAVACFGPEVGTNMHAILSDLNGRGIVGGGFRPI
ncbi:peptidase S1 family protein [Aldersonia kunmingensis]|uniref:peptidase S1 family protein n=1 Tax=Aldersonia kunmingensis TaxID=408066 RepID=UPI00083502C0|nr:peptidase S1 family protein [Aldersonia kunmingensis]